MTEALIYLDADSHLTLQQQLRHKLVDAIVSGVFAAGERLPSSRKLASQLGVARNTVVLVYEQLLDEGLVESRERSGLFVRLDLAAERLDEPGGNNSRTVTGKQHGARWKKRVKPILAHAADEDIPGDWQRYQWPFIDGHFDDSLYPTTQWREASRMALGMRIFEDSELSQMDADDPALIEEIRSKMLPRRGIMASSDEILITLGSQNALYLVTHLLIDSSVTVALEEPGNPRMRELLHERGAGVINQPVDENGMLINSQLDQADLVYVTPSHQVPTAVTMPTQRRQALLKGAARNDQVIIEDDFEHETNYEGQPHPALRSMDKDNRVVYVSALPKILAPGFRMGFIVADASLIREARRMRQLVIGRPSLINQRTAALFLSLGHYDSFMNRLKAEMQERWFQLKEALNLYQGRTVISIPNQGGTSFWVHAPDEVDVGKLAAAAAERGILIEPDTRYYAGKTGSRNWFRLGVTSIPADRIREGVRELRELMWDMTYGEKVILDPDDPSLLSGEELQRTLAGATVIYRTVFVEDCELSLHPDGTMSGVAGAAGEDRDQGRWWVEGNVWYRHWKQWAYGEPEGYRVTVNDRCINWYSLEGRLVDSAEIKLA